jgi:hypothetical protein
MAPDGIRKDRIVTPTANQQRVAAQRLRRRVISKTPVTPRTIFICRTKRLPTFLTL